MTTSTDEASAPVATDDDLDHWVCCALVEGRVPGRLIAFCGVDCTGTEKIPDDVPMTHECVVCADLAGGPCPYGYTC